MVVVAAVDAVCAAAGAAATAAIKPKISERKSNMGLLKKCKSLGKQNPRLEPPRRSRLEHKPGRIASPTPERQPRPRKTLGNPHRSTNLAAAQQAATVAEQHGISLSCRHHLMYACQGTLHPCALDRNRKGEATCRKAHLPLIVGGNSSPA